MSENKIKEIRESQNMTQAELADKVGVSRMSIIRWEKSGTQGVLYKNLDKIAQVLQVPVKALLGRSEETKKSPTDDKSMGQEDLNFYDDDIRICSDETMITIPVVSREMTACCGGGIPAFDVTGSDGDVISWPRCEFRCLDDSHPPFAIYADGDCLASDGIETDDKIIINPAEHPSQGVIVLISLYGMLGLKRFYRLSGGDVLLRSDDGERKLTQSEQEEGNFEILGVMVGSYRPRPKAKPL